MLTHLDAFFEDVITVKLTPDRQGVDIIDQTLLPGEQKRLQLTTPEAVFEAIKQLRVRGAPAIGCSAAIGLAVCARRFSSESTSLSMSSGPP